MSKIPSDVTLLGDPHLGRQFKTGVPLDRRGDREEMQWRDFKKSLMTVTTPFHINMGDLFDKSVVSPKIVLTAAEIYQAASIKNPKVTYVIIEGNHDVSRDTSKRSSFDIFEALVVSAPNIVIIRHEAKLINNYGFVPYSPFVPTVELLKGLPGKLDAIFGHWDIQDWGGDNVIPTAEIARKNCKLAISGHEHLPHTEKRHGVDIIVVGSMQPYTHAEDATGGWYRTVTLAELEKIDASNLNIRVLLQPGEILPAELDCLSLTAKRVEIEKLKVDTSEFESLEMNELLNTALDGLQIRAALMERFSQNAN